MDVRVLAFRLRGGILVVLYLLGFLAPWRHFFPGIRIGTLWLALAALLAHTGWMDMPAATLGVTLAALCCCAAGAIFRVWGAAYLDAGIADGSSAQASPVAAGPYRYLRHPLSLGNWLLALGVSILMPVGGAIFFLAALSFFHLVLISGEERALSARLGEVYRQYRRRVPRFPLSLAAGVPASDARPHWLRSIFSEIYFVGFSLCFAVFAWRYDRWILIKCLLICYGLALIASAIPWRAETISR